MTEKSTLKKTSRKHHFRLPELSWSWVAVILMVGLAAYIVYGLIAFGAPSIPMAPGKDDDSDVDLMDLLGMMGLMTLTR